MCMKLMIDICLETQVLRIFQMTPLEHHHNLEQKISPSSVTHTEQSMFKSNVPKIWFLYVNIF